ncbi:DNA polymerase III subunit delta' [Roseiarcus sp.]|uniref:DNA polymerase III subunit delta' n=1 Tax=Roseiarcus sp. TaxID=1969460 RepID=UPI003F9E9965
MRRPEAEEAPESDAVPGAPHPRHAERLIGHKNAEAEMLSAYREGRLAHAWLIGGPEGVGKATLAWRFARFLFANPDPAAPGVRSARDLSVDLKIAAARHLTALAHPDFSLVRRVWQTDKKKFFTEIRVEDVRDALQVFQMSAAFGGWRVCLVDCAEDLNRNGANALLKMIEEPPARSLILIVSHRPGQVLPTIRSRCRRLRLDPLTETEIVDVIGGLGPPWSDADPAAVARAAKRANGSVREAMGRLSPDSEGVGALIDSTIAGLPHPDPRGVARLAEALAGRASSEAFEAFHRELYEWLAGYAARTVSSPAKAWEIGSLWDRIRAAARETEALNLDRKLHVLAVFAEIAATAPRRR